MDCVPRIPDAKWESMGAFTILLCRLDCRRGLRLTSPVYADGAWTVLGDFPGSSRADMWHQLTLLNFLNSDSRRVIKQLYPSWSPSVIMTDQIRHSPTKENKHCIFSNMHFINQQNYNHYTCLDRQDWYIKRNYSNVPWTPASFGN